jgi:raffinose/stachyose/melibiose transport system substrate-binding protein
MPRKTFTLISFMLIVAFVLAACTTTTPVPTEVPTAVPGQPTTAPTNTTAPQPTVAKPVTVRWWHISTADDQKALWQKFANEYQNAHPNVTIEITVLENEAFKTKMTTVIQSGDPPDIFQSWGGGVMSDYANAGMLRDITADLDANGGAWRNTFGQGALGVYSYKGKNYGVPWDMGMVGWWYNKDLLAKAGMTSFPATWTDFLNGVKALKAAGITPIGIGEGDKWPGMHLWSYLALRIGGAAGVQKAIDRTGSFTDAPFVQAFEKLQELVALTPFQDGFLGAPFGDQCTAVGNGKAAMELTGQWGLSCERQNSADQKGVANEGWAPFPAIEGGAGDPNDAVGGGNGFAVGKNAPDAAVDFLKYITAADQLKQVDAIGMGIAPVKGSETGLSEPLFITLAQQLAKAKYFQLYLDQLLPSAVGSVINDAVQTVYAGKATPQQAAQAIEDSAKQEIK